MKIETSKITLNYRCEECNITAIQNLSEIVDQGTVICENCSDNMYLMDVVDVDE